MQNLKNFIKQRFINEYGNLLRDEMPREKEKITNILNQIIEKMRNNKEIELSQEEKNELLEDLANDFLAMGCLTELMKDPEVTEIMVNGHKKIFVERGGKMELANIKFEDETQLMHLIHNMLAPTRRRVDESYPYTDVMLGDNSRVNIVLRQISLEGPLITIRKFMQGMQKIEDLTTRDTISEQMGRFLIAAIKAKLNVIFAGATGDGKTTTLNILSNYIAPSERIITIEDAAELHLSQEHVVRLEARPPNIEGKGEISIRDLFKNSMRMRPNRIILGEVRGAEALDLLQSISSGHSGSLSVIHARSPRDVVSRLETMIMMFGATMAAEIVRRQISGSIDLLIQHEQLSDGSRKITHIAAITDYKDKDIIVEDLFSFEQENIDSGGKVIGKFVCSGIKPARIQEKFRKHNLSLDDYIK